MLAKNWTEIAHLLAERQAEEWHELIGRMQSQYEQEQDARVKAEVALMIAWQGQPKIPAHQRTLVLEALLKSKMFAGTPYLKELEQLLAKEKEQA